MVRTIYVPVCYHEYRSSWTYLRSSGKKFQAVCLTPVAVVSLAYVWFSLWHCLLEDPELFLLLLVFLLGAHSYHLWWPNYHMVLYHASQANHVSPDVSCLHNVPYFVFSMTAIPWRMRKTTTTQWEGKGESTVTAATIPPTPSQKRWRNTSPTSEMPSVTGTSMTYPPSTWSKYGSCVVCTTERCNESE